MDNSYVELNSITSSSLEKVTCLASEAGKALYSGSALALRSSLEVFRSTMSAPSDALSVISTYSENLVIGNLIGNTDTESAEWKAAPLLDRGLASSLKIIGSGITAPFAGIATLLYAIGNLDKFPNQCKELYSKLSTPKGRSEFAEDVSKTALQVGAAFSGALIGYTLIASLPVSWPALVAGLVIIGAAFLSRVAVNAEATRDEKGNIDMGRFTGKMMKDTGEAILSFGLGVCWGVASIAIIGALNSNNTAVQILGRREVVSSAPEIRNLISTQGAD